MIKGSHITEEHKKAISLKLKGVKKPTYHRNPSLSGPMSGRHHSKESRRKMSLLRKGKVLSVNTKRKISEANYGKVVTERTKQKIRNSLKGKYKIRLGAVLSEETKRKISNSLLGRCSVKKGIPLGEDVKRKISIANKGKSAWNKGKPYLIASLVHKGKIISQEVKNKISYTLKVSERFKLDKNPAWKGGTAKLRYPEEFYQIRKEIYKRDNWSCQECGKSHLQLHCHHIDYDKKNNIPRNLITLCATCHCKTNNTKREFWRDKYRIALQNRFDQVCVGGDKI